MEAFRRQYPDGNNYVVATDADRTFTRRFGEIEVDFVSLELLIKEIV